MDTDEKPAREELCRMRTKKNRMFNRCVALVLSLAMLLVFPVVSFADVFAGSADSAATVEQQADAQSTGDVTGDSGTTGEQAADTEQPAAENSGEDVSGGEAAGSNAGGTTGSEKADVNSTKEKATANSGTTKDETKTEEVKYPEQHFADTVGGTNVNVNAPEGAFPEGTTMKVTAVSDSIVESAVKDAAGNDIAGMQAMDISFYYNGTKVEPKTKVDVQFSSVDIGGTGLKVFHIDPKSGAATDMGADSQSTTNAAVSTDAFSVYVLTGVDSGIHRTTYVFHNGTEKTTKIVKKGDMLEKPASPKKDGYAFTGWFTAETGGAEFTGFGTVGNISADSTVDLYAQFAEGHYVFYKDDNDRTFATETVAEGKEIPLDKTFSIATDKALVGWSETKNGSKLNSLEMGSTDVTLYPIIKTASWITFDTDGGSAVDPEYVLTGDKTVKPSEDPAKEGYDFGGWYKDKKCTQEFTFDSTLSSNITLYAKWDAAQTSFKVIYWKETLTSGQYDYVSTDSEEATTGNKVSAKDYAFNVSYDWWWNKTESEKYDYFHYDSSASDQNISVKGDGSTVVNVRYARNSYTFDFKLNSVGEYNNESYSFPNAQMTIDGGTYTNSGTHYSFTAKYGEDVSTKWPTASNITPVGKFLGWKGGSFTGLHVSKRLNITPELIKDSDKNKTGVTESYVGKWSNHVHQVTLNYYAQNADNDLYSKLDEYCQTANSDGSFSAKDIAGLQYSYSDNKDWNEQGRYYTTYNFYYNRLNYSLEFYNNSDEADEVHSQSSVRYGKNIAGYMYTPERPSTIPSYYEFGGWYTTSDCLDGSQFTGSTMPASNLALYAKWAPDQATVTFDSNGGSSVIAQHVTKGTAATEPVVPTRSGYDFAGWTKDGNAFNFATTITSDTTLVARWTNAIKYTVSYNANGGTGNVPLDNNTYAEGSKAKVLDADGLSYEGKVFVGWGTSATGTASYYPGSSVTISNQNATLYAIWANADKATTYKYDYNGGADSNGNKFQENSAEVNTNITAESDTALGISNKGYRFTGWNTAANGTGKAVAANDIFIVDNDGAANVLYAQWKPLTKITITADSATQTYNGSALSKNSYTLTSGALDTGDTISSITVTGSQTDAGNSKNVVSAAVIKHGNEDVTANYDITYAVGTLTVNPVAIELTANSATKVYDGSALTAYGYKITNGAFVGTDGLKSVTVSGSQTFVGSSASTITGHSLKEGTKADNYTITYKPGTLTVTQASIALTITADSDSKTYDGSALTKNTYKSTGTLANGDEIKGVTLTGSQTDAGNSKNVASAAVIKHGDTDVTANYNITYTPGTLTVNPVAIKLTADSATKAYDGTALTANGYKITNGAFVGEDGFASVAVSGSQTLVGTSDNTITGHTLADGTKAGNYTITYDNGTLEVTKASIELKIAANDAQKTYDGTALMNGRYTATGTLATGDAITNVTVTGSQIDAGHSSNVASNAVVMHGATNVTANYDISYTSGTLTVNPVAIKLTADSATKAYDGTALTANGYKITNGAFVGEDGFDTVTVEGSQTQVGSSDNVIKAYTLKDGTNPVNYNITEFKGTLSITNENPIAITVTAANDHKTYDGTALTNETSSITAGKLATGDSYTATVTGKQTDAGDSANTVRDIQVWHDNGDGTTTDVTANYAITPANGKLTVNPVAITLKAKGATKVYDGIALTANEYTITNGAFVGTDGLASVAVSGSQTLVGISDNTITGHVLKEGTKASNYTITYEKGTLEVTKASIPLTITAGSASQTYNGTALTKHDYTHTGTLATGDTITSVTETGSQTNAGSSKNVASAAVIMHDGTNVTDNYDITYGDGTLTVDPAPLTVTTGSAEKVYDGNPLTKDDASIAGLVNNETATVTATGSQTDAGSSSNTYEITWGNTNKDNYAITENLGTLKVNKRPITITAGSKSKIFDNLPLTYNFASLTNGTLADNQYAVYSASGTITNPGTAPNVPDVHIYIMETPTPAYAVRMMAVNEPVEVTDNYQIEKINGVLEVTAQTPTPNPPAADKYSLTINYVDQNGKTVADAYANQFNQNDPYSVDSPIITGYELVDSTQATVAGSMPGQNLTVTVVYKKTSTEPQNPKTPTTPANKPQSDKSADTGDGFSLITWMLLAMIGAAGAVGTGFAVRKREDDNE